MVRICVDVHFMYRYVCVDGCMVGMCIDVYFLSICVCVCVKQIRFYHESGNMHILNDRCPFHQRD